MGISVKRTLEYKTWLSTLTGKNKAQVEKRVQKIENEGHFGTTKSLGDGLYEIKFNDGTRIYFARTGQTEITLIYGGNKNGQSKDIAQAKKLLNR